MTQFYLQIRNVELGPLSKEELLVLKREGLIAESDSVHEKRHANLHLLQNKYLEKRSEPDFTRSQLSKMQTARIDAPPLRATVIYKYAVPFSKIPTQVNLP